GRPTAGHGIRGRNPLGAEARGGGAVLEVADDAVLEPLGRFAYGRVRARDLRGVGAAVEGDAALPDARDPTRLPDVARRVAVDEHEVRTQSGRDAATIVEAEELRGDARRRGERLDRREPGRDEQLELVVH